MALQRGEVQVDETSGSGTGRATGEAPADLQALTARVAEARRRVAAGDLPLLEGLARSLSSTLSRPTAPATPDMVDRLAALQDEVEALLAAAAEQREMAGKRVEELTVRGRARRAYARGG